MGRAAAEVVAGFLRIEEAEMLTELLRSAGIEAWCQGAIASCLGALIPGAGGGAKLLVEPERADQARELIAHSGILGGVAGDLQATGDGSAAARPAFPLYPLLVTLAVVGLTLLRLAISP